MNIFIKNIVHSKLKLHLHVILALFYPLCFLIIKNNDQLNLNLRLLIPSISLLSLTTVVIWLLALVLSKDKQKASIITTISILWLFSYSTIEAFLKSTSMFGFILGRERYLIPIYLLSGICFWFLIIRNAKIFKNIKQISRFINIMLCICYVSFLIQIPYHFRCNTSGKICNRTVNQKSITSKTESIKKKVNIYYIILDSYPSGNVLNRVFNMDNSTFQKGLEDRGFYIAKRSHSNYAFTYTSLSSTLNMEYLQHLVQNESQHSKNYGTLSLLMVDNKVFDEFRILGFNIVNLDNMWEVSASKDSEKFYNEFTRTLIIMTPLKSIYLRVLSIPEFRKSTLNDLTFLQMTQKSDKPTFYFVHVPCPHPPFVFKKDGSSPGFFEAIFRQSNPKQQLVDQIKYLNTLVLTTLDSINKKDPNSIVVVQGDHGPAFTFQPFLEISAPPTKSFLYAQFGILNAYRLPPSIQEKLYDSISPVNTFRLILNDFRTAQLPLLPDNSFYSNHIFPYFFTPVSPESLK